MVNRELVAAVRDVLAAHADSSRAAPMQAYMKSEMPYYGISNPTQQRLLRDVFSAHPIASFDDWHDTVLALWNEARYREERYAALALVGARRYVSFRTLQALPLIEELIVTGTWWMGSRRMRSAICCDATRIRCGQRCWWSQGADPWLRRAAIICQVGFKTATDCQLLFACIEPSLGERGFFLRKAIGWALRDYAKAEPEEVRRYVSRNETRLSGLSRREALKHLN